MNLIPNFGIVMVFLISIKSFSISLPQAIQENKVTVTFTNNGHFKGQSTEVIITNISTSNVELNSNLGIIIQSEDNTSQNLVISEPIVAQLAPKKTFSKLVNTFCVNLFKASPHKDEKYTYKEEADFYLMKMLTFIYTKKTLTDESQNAVWACVDGKKNLYISNQKTPHILELQKLVASIHDEKVALKLIPKDTVLSIENYRSFQIQGSYDLFIKKEGSYTALLEDSTGKALYTFLKNEQHPNGLYPLRYMYNYNDAKEKPFYITIYLNGQIIEKNKAINDPRPKRYERLSFKSTTVFNIKQPVMANLNIVDSSGNIYINYFSNKKLQAGTLPFDYSFTSSRPTNALLYLQLTDNSGKVYSRQELSTTKNLIALQGMIHARLQQGTDVVFGLYSKEDVLLEEFENRRFDKGLQMLSYRFTFDKTSKEEVFLKLKDKRTGEVIQSEKVFIK